MADKYDRDTHIELVRPVYSWWGTKKNPGTRGFIVGYNPARGHIVNLPNGDMIYLLDRDFRVLSKGTNG